MAFYLFDNKNRKIWFLVLIVSRMTKQKPFSVVEFAFFEV